MQNNLKIVHIKKENTDEDAKYMWENILKPKWEAKRRKEAEQWFKEKYKTDPPQFIKK